MAFVRTVLIIAALVGGWVVLRAESSVHGITPAQAQLTR